MWSLRKVIITKIEFIKLMKFPGEWIDWDMYPDDLSRLQIGGYVAGSEEGSEHDRFGAFLWWIAHYENISQLEKLERLTYLDSDKGMAEDARRRINSELKKFK